MHYLNEHHLFIFLLQLFLILSIVKILSFFIKKIKQPTITVEIFVGILLGPTILGKYFPELHNYIFPRDLVQQNMLETIAWLSILLLLLATGLEINFSSVWKQRFSAIKISISDIIIPIIIAFVPIYFLPERYFANSSNKLILSFFIAIIMTISALPIAIRALHDLNILKTDTGFLTVSALTINDIIGWILFTVLLSIFTGKNIDYIKIIFIILATVIFVKLALTYGKRIVDTLLRRFSLNRKDETVEALSIVILTGMLFGMITLKIGIHSLFGFFLAGIAVGESKFLTEKARATISNFIYSIFAPIFFVNIGLKIDFFANFDLFLLVIIAGVGIFGRYMGAWFGGRLSNIRGKNLKILSIAHTPGGEMHIVVSLIALEYGLLTEQLFVSIVGGAILSSMITGPWMSLALKESLKIKLDKYIDFEKNCYDVNSTNKLDAISEILKESTLPKSLNKEEVLDEIIKREKTFSTSVEKGISLPHARIDNIEEPIIIFARSLKGIIWDSPDGKLTRLIFLILYPKSKPEYQLKIIKKLLLRIKHIEVIDLIINEKDNLNLKKLLEKVLK